MTKVPQQHPFKCTVLWQLCVELRDCFGPLLKEHASPRGGARLRQTSASATDLNQGTETGYIMGGLRSAGAPQHPAAAFQDMSDVEGGRGPAFQVCTDHVLGGATAQDAPRSEGPAAGESKNPDLTNRDRMAVSSVVTNFGCPNWTVRGVQ